MIPVLLLFIPLVAGILGFFINMNWQFLDAYSKKRESEPKMIELHKWNKNSPVLCDKMHFKESSYVNPIALKFLDNELAKNWFMEELIHHFIMRRDRF